MSLRVLDRPGRAGLLHTPTIPVLFLVLSAGGAAPLPTSPEPKSGQAAEVAEVEHPQPVSLDARIAEARALLEKDDFEGALAEARRIVEAEPGSARARALLGDALYRRGDFDEAEEAYRRSVALDDACAEGHFGVGRILRTLGRYGEAAPHFHRAAALDPEKPLYVRTLANHLAKRSDTIAMMERYLELAGSEEERLRKNVAAWIALLKHLGDDPLGQVVKSEPTDLPMNVLRGQAYLKADVNKAKGERFAFDTGATGMTISPRLARSAKVEVIRPFEIVGMGGKGSVAGDLVLIRELSLGGITLRNVSATIAEPKGPEEGLIGPSLFSAFLIRIDLKSGLLSLRPRTASAPDTGDLRRDGPENENRADRPHDAVSSTPGVSPGLDGSSPAGGGARATGDVETSAVGGQANQDTSTPAENRDEKTPASGRAGDGTALDTKPSGVVTLSFRNVGGQIVVPATLNGVTLNAMVDTGASSSLSSFSAVPRVPGLEVLSEALSTGRSMGLAGPMGRKTIRRATLGFAGKEFESSGLPNVDLSHFSRALESEVYLVIGFPELEPFTLEIDYATNSLRLDPAAR